MLKLGTNNIDKIYLGSTKIAKAYLGNTLVYEAFKKQYYLKLKIITISTPLDPEGYQLDEDIQYSISITNAGVMPFNTNTTGDFQLICDITGDEWTIQSINPGETLTYTCYYTVLPEDVETEAVTCETYISSDDPNWETFIHSLDDPTDVDPRASVTSTVHNYSKDYLTFVALESGTFTLTIPTNVNSTYMTSVSYSINNGETWVTTLVDNTKQTITTPTIGSGGKVLWKGIGTKLSTRDNRGYSSYFSSTVDFQCYGNIMSLLYEDNFVNLTTISSYAFAYLFTYSTLTNCSNLILPATTLGEYCYKNMFLYSNKLISSIRILPANNLPRRCYAYMFSNCNNLINGPQEISATIHSSTAVCHSMFKSCTSLTTAPILYTQRLVGYDYMMMFDGCSSLNYIKMLATSLSTQSLDSWVDGVAATGTFIKNAAASWTTTGASGVPSGWTVETVTE